MSNMLAAGGLRRACPSCRAQLVNLAARRGSGTTGIRSARPTFSSPVLGSPRRPLRAFATSSRLRNEPHDRSNEGNQSEDNVSDIERTVRETRQRFRDTLPKGYLNDKEYALYVRLYGTPLRDTIPEDVGIPFSGVETPPPRPAGSDPDDPTLLREIEGGEYEEVPYSLDRKNQEDTPPAEDEIEHTEPGDESLSDDQRTYINVVARNQREYDALVKLQQDFEQATLKSTEEAEEEEVIRSEEEESYEVHEGSEVDAALQREIDESRLREQRALSSFSASEAPETSQEQDAWGFEDVVSETSLTATRTHPITKQGRFSTNPKTLGLPQSTFSQPISQLLERTSTRHVREAAEDALGGPGLPGSPATPSSKRSTPQSAVGLQAGQHRMSEIEADAFIATVLPPSYASAMGSLVEVRKRLGTQWIQDLIRRKGGQGPRVLDAGAGGAGLAAWQDILQAEWDVMRDEGQVKGAYPPGKKAVVVGSDHLRHRVSRFLHNTSFLPRLPDYVHSVDTAGQHIDAPQHPQPRKTYDVIIASYMLLPIKEGHRRKAVLNQLWSLLSPEGGVLVFIEKAHPRGFEAVADIREKLINEYLITPDPRQERSDGEEFDPAFHRVKEPGFIVAPCTNHRACPMYTTPGKNDGRKDFCSFQQRFTRPRYMQQILGAKHRNHDDVQFSYVAIQRGGDPGKNHVAGEEATERAFAGYENADEAPNMLSLPRQILPPLKRKGHVQLELCTPSGRIERWTVPRSRGKQSYHDARKTAWGDLWPLGAKVRIERKLRLGRPEAEDDGGVRARRAKDALNKRQNVVDVEYDEAGFAGAKETKGPPLRRTKGGKKPPRKSLQQSLFGDDKDKDE